MVNHFKHFFLQYGFIDVGHDGEHHLCGEEVLGHEAVQHGCGNAFYAGACAQDGCFQGMPFEEERLEAVVDNPCANWNNSSALLTPTSIY